MSRRLWEGQSYKCRLEHLSEKIDKCIRRERFKEAQILCAELIKECEIAKSLIGVTKKVKTKKPCDCGFDHGVDISDGPCACPCHDNNVRKLR